MSVSARPGYFRYCDGESGWILSAFNASQDRFGLAVTDHGRGMTSDDVKNVNAFIQFGKLEQGKAGLGLGLAIARKTSFLHGGALTIKSVLGERTGVTIELPWK